MRYTYQNYASISPHDMSDAMRLNSWKTGVEIIKRNFWTGVGVGDLQNECVKVSRELFPEITNDDDRKMPHNEFIWIWAATGVFGFAAYCIAFLLPFIAYARRSNWLFVVFYIIFFSSFMTEPALEEQVGTAFYLLFLLIFLNYFNYQPAAGE